MDETTLTALASKFPQPIRRAYRAAVIGKSRRDAIRAQCVRCAGMKMHTVARCHMDACPLWPYRMGSRSRTIEVAAGLPPSLPIL